MGVKEIREAFNKWLDGNLPSGVEKYENGFFAGYEAALAALDPEAIKRAYRKGCIECEDGSFDLISDNGIGFCKKCGGIAQIPKRAAILQSSPADQGPAQKELINGKPTWYPDPDPITGRPLFMLIEHPKLGFVPTYGGPFDSYTLPERDEDESDDKHIRFTCQRYDHDEGTWIENEIESINFVLVSERWLMDIEPAQDNEWDAFTKKEMWEQIQEIREMVGADGTMSICSAIETWADRKAELAQDEGRGSNESLHFNITRMRG